MDIYIVAAALNNTKFKFDELLLYVTRFLKTDHLHTKTEI